MAVTARHARLALTAAIIVVWGIAGSTAHAGTSTQRFFLSPSHNIECELDNSAALGHLAYCESLNAPQSVTLSPHGFLKVCHGTRCLSDGPENDPTLAYGHSVSLGPFRCTSLITGVRCTTTSGHGFAISRTAITKL